MEKPKYFCVKKYFVLVTTLMTSLAAIVEVIFFIWLLYYDKDGKTVDVHMGLPHAEDTKIRVRF